MRVPSVVRNAIVPLGAACCLLPMIPSSVALVAGIIVALAIGNPHLAQSRAVSRRLLTASIIGLGAAMDLRVVARVGAHAFAYTAASLAICGLLGYALVRVLGVERRTGALITVGTAICGGSAIAALVPILRPKDHEVSVALATVFFLNALALCLFPWIGHAVGLTPERFGLWSALAIHDTSSVVAAALAYHPHAVAIATTVKLTRALWIVPVTFAVGMVHERREGGGAAKLPWFILGFLAAAALVTAVPSLRPAGQVLAAVARRGLVVSLFLIGCSITRQALGAVGMRPFAHGLLLWVAMAGLSLGAFVLGMVG
jgi:uncharacterized integral membrane protein (TIGR00698 family)